LDKTIRSPAILGGIGQELFQAAFLQVLVGLEILETVEASFHGTQ